MSDLEKNKNLGNDTDNSNKKHPEVAAQLGVSTNAVNEVLTNPFAKRTRNNLEKFKSSEHGKAIGEEKLSQIIVDNEGTDVAGIVKFKHQDYRHSKEQSIDRNTCLDFSTPSNEHLDSLSTFLGEESMGRFLVDVMGCEKCRQYSYEGTGYLTVFYPKYFTIGEDYSFVRNHYHTPSGDMVIREVLSN